MKKVILIITLTSAALLLTACGGPRSKAEEFARLLQAGRTSEAKKLCSDRGEMMVDWVAQSFRNAGDDFRIVRVEEQGDRARVWCRFSKKGEELYMDMVKIDGTWYVDIHK